MMQSFPASAGDSQESQLHHSGLAAGARALGPSWHGQRQPRSGLARQWHSRLPTPWHAPKLSTSLPVCFPLHPLVLAPRAPLFSRKRNRDCRIHCSGPFLIFFRSSIRPGPFILRRSPATASLRPKPGRVDGSIARNSPASPQFEVHRRPCMVFLSIAGTRDDGWSTSAAVIVTPFSP